MEENNPLDVSSSSFDPLAALYSEDVVIPDTSAPIVDNVEKFIASLNKPTTSGKKSEKNKLIPAAVQRQFTEEQMPIKCPRRQGNNVLTYMERQKKGPMSVLQKCVENQTRIKVTTRKLNGTRGFMEGVLIAYDKHWNLALADVDETYSRPRHRKPEYDNGKKVEKPLQPERMGQSVIRIVKTRRNTELCQRHVPQIVLRGEHVILIQPLFSS